MIFRAMVCTTPPTRTELGLSERLVFIEATNHQDAQLRLPALVANVWAVPVESVELTNLTPESELQANPFAEGASPDHALFVIGWKDGRPAFPSISMGAPLFLLSRELDRVLAAYMTLPRASVTAVQAAMDGEWTKQVQRLLKDAERLNFWQAHDGYTGQRAENGEWRFSDGGGTECKGDTLREALDQLKALQPDLRGRWEDQDAWEG
jgi:hypothetical protein